ncbi:alpha/beta fold hydrolase, partial [Streptomyces hydrogenans]
MHTLALRGATLGYDDVGPTTGPPVLLIHGHPFNRSLWEPQVAALAAAGHRVI